MASFLERVRAQFDAKQQGSLGILMPKAPERHRNLIRTTSFDRADWQGARRTTAIGDMIDDLDVGDEHKGGERPGFDQAPELTQGLFHMFNKAVPELAGKREIERDLWVARKILEEMQEHPELRDLQDSTVGSQMMSTMAVTAMQEPLHEILTRTGNSPAPDAPGKGGGGGQQQQPGGGGGQPDPNAQGQGSGGQGQGQGQQEQDPNNPNGQGQAGQQPGQGQGQGPGQGAQGPDGLNDEDLSDTETDEFDAEAEAEAQEAEWEKAMEDWADDLGLDRLIDKMVEQANDEVQEVEDARRGIGLEDGEWYSMSPEEQMKMAERLRTPEMKALADIVGRMKRFALGIKATKVTDEPHEPYDVEYGDNLLAATKAQFALLGHPATRPEFYRRYVERELLVYKKRGKAEAGKGPIVMCIDKSGSMSGGPFNWAMGVAEALRRFAAEDERDIHVMFFGNNNDRTKFEFPKGKAPFEKILAFLGTVANGGTQFDGVLTEALQKASTAFDGDGKGKADIVFITDGCAHLDDEWINNFNAERERVGVRVYSIYIGGSYDYGHTSGPLQLLGKLSDATIPVKELKPEAVKDLFTKVA